MVKHIFLARYAQNKNMEKLPIFDQTLGLTPLKKSQLFGFINFLSWKRFFLSRIWYNTFACRILPKIFDWNYGLTPLKKSKFLGFINMLFLKPRKAFFLF